MQRDNRLRCSLHLSFFVEGGVIFRVHYHEVNVVGQVMNRVRVREGGGLGLGMVVDLFLCCLFQQCGM
jgi:hypothetical protein